MAQRRLQLPVGPARLNDTGIPAMNSRLPTRMPRE